MGVYRRKDTGKWMVDVAITLPDGSERRARRTSPVQTKRGAEAYEREVRVALVDGSYGQTNTIPTLSEFSEDLIKNYARANNKPSEVTAKRSIFKKHLNPVLGRKRLDEIGSRDIERYKASKLETGLSRKSVNNQLACLRKALNLAVEWEVIPSAPRIKAMRCEEAEIDFLDFEESDRFLDAADSGLPRAMLTVALNTGLRIGELRALKWEDVDLRRGLLRVRRNDWKGHIGLPKSGKGREIPLNEDALRALKEHRHLRADWIFCQEDGALLTEDQGRRMIRRACRLAGLRYIGWHTLRHTFASQLVMRGVPLKSVQELLGHASITTTMRYAHLSPDVRRDAVNTLARSQRHDGGTNAVSSE